MPLAFGARELALVHFIYWCRCSQTDLCRPSLASYTQFMDYTGRVRSQDVEISNFLSLGLEAFFFIYLWNPSSSVTWMKENWLQMNEVLFIGTWPVWPGCATRCIGDDQVHMLIHPFAASFGNLSLRSILKKPHSMPREKVKKRSQQTSSESIYNGIHIIYLLYSTFV